MKIFHLSVNPNLNSKLCAENFKLRSQSKLLRAATITAQLIVSADSESEARKIAANHTNDPAWMETKLVLANEASVKKGKVLMESWTFLDMK